MKLNIPEDCLLGCHLSISGGVDNAPERAMKLGCTAGQIFTSSNRRWAIRDLKDGEAEAFIEGSDDLPGKISAHACYLINLAKDEQDPWEKSVQTLIKEVERASELNIPYLVLHPGSHVGSGEQQGIERVIQGLDRVVEETQDSEVKILLETMAGQGTGLGYRFQHLLDMKEGTREPNRFGYCLDTCHMHAGGYDLSSESNYNQVMDEVESVLGLEDIEMLHLNDSKGEYDSRVDRHEHLGEGTIGLAAFRCIMQDSRWEDVPKILETPVDDDWEEDYGRNLRILLDFVT